MDYTKSCHNKIITVYYPNKDNNKPKAYQTVTQIQSKNAFEFST